MHISDTINQLEKEANCIARIAASTAKRKPDSMTALAYYALQRPNSEDIFLGWEALDELRFFSPVTTHELNITGRD